MEFRIPQPTGAEHPAADENVPGILLYYKYVPMNEQQVEEVAQFYEQLCSKLGLNGRIRVARDGVNVTVGGAMASLRAHAAAVRAHSLLDGGDVDFKFAVSSGPRNDATLRETGMDTLVVRRCEELVTLGPLARSRADPRASTAPHLAPQQFHQLLARAATAAAAQGPGQDGAREGPAGTVTVAAAAAAAAARDCSGAATGAGPEAADGGGAGAGGDGGDGDSPLGPVVLLDARNVYETRIGHFDAGPTVPTLDPRTRAFSDLPAWLDEHEEALRNRTVLMYCTGGVRCERASAYLREKGAGFERVFQLSEETRQGRPRARLETQGRTCALRKKLRDLADFVFVDGPHRLPLFIKEEPDAFAIAAAADDDADSGSAATSAGVLADGGGDGCQAEASERRPKVAAAAAAAAKRAWLLPPELYGCGAAPAADGVTSCTAAPSYVDELQYTRQVAGWRESLAAVRAAVRELGPFDGVFGFSQGAGVAAALCALQQESRRQRPRPAAPAGPPAEADEADAAAGCDCGFRFAILASGFPPAVPELHDLLARVAPLELPSLHVYGSGAGAGPAAATAAPAGGDGEPAVALAAAAADRQIPRVQSEALAAVFAAAGPWAAIAGAAPPVGTNDGGGSDGLGGGGWRRRHLVHQCGHLIPATRAHAETFRAFLAEQCAAAGPGPGIAEERVAQGA
ncbi:hypothetical protein GPECTOR_28g805 [Gonium pectorale]|uniref:Rhodanese domain-containing protein n=1 Tax=Gonium pectorale TaxID=33097 RepID=A0A150GF01_GONPE|nr:hypothetical protein GPECTOR_28g805 [Gonium pectorale]|eukprot:KXZ48398.1 hypothetical protein GPECTOR_28g805 [Gonium pectorale]